MVSIELRSEMVGLASQPKALDRLCVDTRRLLRLVGPRVSAAQDEQMQFRRCRICTPDEETKTCVICGFTAAMPWQYGLHLRINPETCQRIAAKKARRWASKT
jgi:hypothetical protein